MRLLIFLCALFACQNMWAQESGYARSLQAQRTRQYDTAIMYVQKAISFFEHRQMKDSLVLAYVLKGDIVWSQSGTKPALQILDKALTIARTLPPKSMPLVAALSKKAQMHIHNAENDQAKKYFKQALANIPANALPNDVYSTLYIRISWMYLELQQFTPALQYAEEAKTTIEKLHGKDARQLLSVYQSLLLITQDLGAYNQSEQYARELSRLADIHLAPDHSSKGLVHNDIGSLYELMYRYDEALYHRQQMVKIIQADYAKHKNPQLLAIAYNNMGSLYQSMGELQLAEEYFEKAKNLHEINFGPKGAGFVRPLVHAANAKKDLGKYNEADKLYSRAYNLQKEIDAHDWQNMAYVETHYGDLFFLQKNYARAENYYQQALTHYTKANIDHTYTTEQTRNTLAETYARTGRAKEALVILEDVLRLQKKLYPKGNIAIAGQYNKISETWLLNQQPEKALLYSDSIFQELLQLPELPDSNWIKKLPYNHHIIQYLQNRAAIKKALYEQKNSLLYLRHIIAIATEYGYFLEKSLPALRTQASLMQLAQQHKQIYNAAIEACWQLSQKRHAPHYLTKAFDFAERSRGLMLRLASNNIMVDAGKSTRSAAEETDLFWRKRIGSLNARYLDAGKGNDSLLTLLTTSMESYYRFQDSILQSGEGEWIKSKYRLRPASIAQIQNGLLNNGQTLLQYAVTDKNIFVFVLTKNNFSVHQLSSAVLSEVNVLKNLYNLTGEKFSKASYRLFQALIQPVQKQFESKKLVIIPDGELFNLNFELLVSNGTEKNFGKMKYLIHNYEIYYHLSATNAIIKPNNTTTNKKAMLITPVFTDQMKQAYRQSVSAGAQPDPLYFNLLRQPFAIQAAKQIGDYITNDLFAEQAAVESAFRQHANDYYILHLGTHAEINNAAPLQSRFFMAKPILPDSVAPDDGYLHAYEIYAMRLRAALAVLTACETGTGYISDGEGILSLAHSFMYAGCPSVVMSLWKIDERASASIIASFYQYLSQGKTKSEALRLAKLQHIKKSGAAAAHPYFWAGMTLVGDESAVFESNTGKIWMVTLLIISLACTGLYFRLRKQKHSHFL